MCDKKLSILLYSILCVVTLVIVLLISTPWVYFNSLEYTASRSITESGTKNGTESGYVLSLNSADQSTGGAFNVMSLQCLVAQIDPGRVVVVEPFIVGSVWGAHLSGDEQEMARENNVRLSDIYDIRKWEGVASSHGFARFASWEEFLLYAPRDLILVDFHWYSECSVPQLSEKLTPFISFYNFSVVKTVCFDFVKSGRLSLDQFKKQLYGAFTPSSVSVVFSTFNGVIQGGDVTNRYIIGVNQCSRGSMGSFIILDPSRRILNDVNRYKNKFLSGQNSYLTIMIRLEHPILSYGIKNAEITTKMCITHITDAFLKIKTKKITNKVFFAMDFGKYGSLEFINGYRGNNTAIDIHLRSFFRTIFEENLTFHEWEESFQNITGLTTGGAGPYIAGMQKALASQGRCLILAGGGSFQHSAMNLYKGNRKSKDFCFIQLNERCNTIAAVLP